MGQKRPIIHVSSRIRYKSKINFYILYFEWFTNIFYSKTESKVGNYGDRNI